MQQSIYGNGLSRTPANYVPLTPLHFLDRSAEQYPDRIAIIHGSFQQTWSETRHRCRRLASALVKRGVQPGDTVSILAPNTPAMLEAHFGIPLSGAVLNSINCRLDADGVRFILQHGECKILLVDREFSELVSRATADMPNKPLIIDINDIEAPLGKAIGELDYERLLQEGTQDFEGVWPSDEWNAIALNYTSGTTSDPKGVVPSHRGTYVMSMLQLTDWGMPRNPTYLWTLPMFHANGWCFTWAITAAAGTHVCMRKVTAKNIFDAIADHGVDHFCAAPIVLSSIASAPESEKRPLPHSVRVRTAGSPPPAAVLKAVLALGFEVEHVYGITEASGTPVSCYINPAWSQLDKDEQSRLMARQGNRSAGLEGLMVADPDTLEPVPFDGKTQGELLLKGNIVMKGYLKNEEATENAFAGGWFHTGDVAVVHADGYVQITDRSKDVIISGGENISSVEVEDVLHCHPAILIAAVVSQPDAKWGETPCAFIELKAGVEQPSEAEIIAFCRARLAHFKCPKKVMFCELPKTGTGKIQKFRLRELAGSRAAITELAKA
ncbi:MULTISPECIES: acyl-CoA synthetase [unclassified Herbaspirillum]|uniref:acyl-CoA synthetase n=1 Tax=unclassified Herbaspirillum TaxID=2624150 RepID=UPI000E2E77C1|nr:MULTISPECIES: acyl-CoA synthetase [unclassified Herbaspirillum]RFB70872.1 acyl-CoA synthetase [Herbaspirillum sp. 3R-3a1]TFI08606.1 acyl-CoA synthetase [Herbaspirillum sp. 3R11]TFI15021.1 acyl-CoA synthetase [Herbaspirillum sp. 3R-11]TFI25419.1 acyl-CoA synthetase [Herbaspirillum sp. 3C11]